MRSPQVAYETSPWPRLLRDSTNWSRSGAASVFCEDLARSRRGLWCSTSRSDTRADRSVPFPSITPVAAELLTSRIKDLRGPQWPKY